MLLKKGLNITDVGDSFEFEFGDNIGKITSRMLPMLLGESRFNSVGYAVLDRAKMLAFSEIDHWYKARGSIAEHLVNEYLKAFYKAKKKVDIELKHFDMTSFQGYDMFHESYSYGNSRFGGTPDLAIIKPTEHRATVEVKSKNTKHYDFIVNRKEIPLEELRQGQQLAYLSKTDTLIMGYVFFTDFQEELIIDAVKDDTSGSFNGESLAKLLQFDFRNVIVKISFHTIDRDNIEVLMESAYSTLHTFVENKVIPKKYFNMDEIDLLLDYIEKGNDIPEEELFDSF